MGVSTYEGLKSHIGHVVTVVSYGPEHEYEGDPENVAIECETCGEVLFDFNRVPESQEIDVRSEMGEN